MRTGQELRTRTDALGAKGREDPKMRARGIRGAKEGPQKWAKGPDAPVTLRPSFGERQPGLGPLSVVPDYTGPCPESDLQAVIDSLRERLAWVRIPPESLQYHPQAHILEASC